jgi:hypothetical protein
MSLSLPIEFNGVPIKDGDSSLTPLQVLISDNLEVRHVLGREPALVYLVYTEKGTTWAVIEKDADRVVMRFSRTNFNVIIKVE